MRFVYESLFIWIVWFYALTQPYPLVTSFGFHFMLTILIKQIIVQIQSAKKQLYYLYYL